MEDAANREVRSRGRRQFDAVHKWSATAAAAVALTFSIYNFFELNRSPVVDVTLPHILRITQGKDVWFYIQPTVSTRLNTQAVEVIEDASLQLYPIGSISRSKRPTFFWNSNVEWTYDFKSDLLNYKFASDPAPLIVSQEKPQQPTIGFESDDWKFQPGRYEGLLQLHRFKNRTPLVKKFCLEITKEAIDAFRSGDPRDWYLFRNDVTSSSSHKKSGCYSFLP
ncbi:hypothetical protein ABZ612_36965 [Streptomyces avermitilis]|uniref:hypothetical protein n=1 Tax=Streptomyces avermitilis TaxID=33903 RepID=UPI0033FE4356